MKNTANPMIPYKTISEKWQVIEVYSEKVLRPVNPYATIEEKYFYQRKSETESWGDCFVRERKEWQAQHGSLSVATSLPVAQYQAEDLPEAVTQQRTSMNEIWHEVIGWKEPYEEHLDQMDPNYATRLFIPIN